MSVPVNPETPPQLLEERAPDSVNEIECAVRATETVVLSPYSDTPEESSQRESVDQSTIQSASAAPSDSDGHSEQILPSTPVPIVVPATADSEDDTRMWNQRMWNRCVKKATDFDSKTSPRSAFITKANRPTHIRTVAIIGRKAGVSRSEVEELLALELRKGMMGRGLTKKDLFKYVAEEYPIEPNQIESATPAPVIEPIPRPSSDECLERWQRIADILQRDFLDPDLEAVKIIYACVAAHKISAHPPAWVMALAPAGSMKTVTLETLDGLPGVHSVDEVTPQTFISGKLDESDHERTTSASFLHRIGEQGILVVPDFSTILEIDPKTRGKILAQLRRIYDGHLRREFGSDENLQDREWHGRITLLAGATPEADSYHKVFAALGERFVRIRWPRAGGAQAAMIAMKQKKDVFAVFQTAVHNFLLPILSWPEIPAPNLPEALLLRLAHLSELVALARTYVPRDSRNREIDGAVEAESNTRLPQELVQIGRGWAALMGRDEVNSEDFELIRRAAWDCIPAVRATLLKAVMSGQKPHTIGLPKATADRGLEDLQVVGLVVKQTESNCLGMPPGEVQYQLSESAKTLLARSDGQG